MINIIKSVLFDCGYEDVVQTEIEFEKLEYKIDIFKNEDVGSQVFIVLQTLESQLVSLSGIKDFIIEIANFFRESDIYLPDMDKNTSLVFCVKNDINSEKLDALKVKIEDDPFYFKKYVFLRKAKNLSSFVLSFLYRNYSSPKYFCKICVLSMVKKFFLHRKIFVNPKRSGNLKLMVFLILIKKTKRILTVLCQ